RAWALGATGAAIVAAGAVVRFVPRLGGALAGAFARRRPAALGARVVLALALPLALRSSPYWTFVATLALLYVTIGQGLNLQIGTAGGINLARAARAGPRGHPGGPLSGPPRGGERPPRGGVDERAKRHGLKPIPG